MTDRTSVSDTAGPFGTGRTTSISRSQNKVALQIMIPTDSTLCNLPLGLRERSGETTLVTWQVHHN